MSEALEGLCLKFVNNQLQLLDQTLLPHEEKWLRIESLEQMEEAIQLLRVRGAPAIGVSAGLMLAQLAIEGKSIAELFHAAEVLKAARPTAVNLMWAMNEMVLKYSQEDFDCKKMIQLAFDIFHEDVQLCLNMAKQGAPFIKDGDGILTHCNTGGLATAGIGTALGVIRYAHEQGKKIHVYVDETRPLLQGGRLTVWECQKLGIPYTLICDNMAASLMREGKIQKVFLGSDRVARNGDFANKIGTYNVAILAHYHNVEFYPVAPYSTIDPDCPSGQEIPIELRSAKEVQGVRDYLWAMEEAPAWNPAFDVTPVDLVTRFIFDHGSFTAEELKLARHLERPKD